MKNKIGALFDLDGVVIDTETTYTVFWSDIEAKYPTGIPNFAIKIKGSNLKSIRSYYPDEDIWNNIIKSLADFEENMPYNIFPDALRFLNDLKDNNIPCAMVTSSGKAKLDRLFRQHPQLKSYFNAIVSGEMVSKSKPDPECFIKGAELINCPIKDCVVFEDSIYGVTAGIASGAKVVALTTTFPDTIINSKADKFMESFADFGIAELNALFQY